MLLWYKLFNFFLNFIFSKNRKGSLFDHENSILAANSESGVSRVEYDNDNYKIHVNVKDFRPEELVVKTVDNTVKVIKFVN